MAIEETVAALQKDIASAQRRHASADAQAQQAGARASAVREDLEAEFGVTTAEQAREELAELDRQLAGEVAEVQRQLELAGGAA
jgi:methylphosphotriester-DNA--protein-cysteine methyltransferase